MATKPIWMVRAGKSGAFAEDFLDESFVGIGFDSAGEIVLPIDRASLDEAIRKSNPTFRPGKVSNVVSQVTRFYTEINIGDSVMTYDPTQRLYFIGEVLSDVNVAKHELSRCRSVKWTHQVSRDALPSATRNSLGSILTLFLVQGEAADSVWSHAKPLGSTIVDDTTEDPSPSDNDAPTEDIEAQANEFIDDMVARLDPHDVELLVGEILEAMGFRAEVSEIGPDRGVDVFASPDGLGLQEPRIFVEVKHRLGTRIGSEQIRSFIGGRQSGDRCLYVSTGGFTREAKYEAERSNIPVTLITLPKLRSLVLEHYHRFSPTGLALFPLKRIYWPVG